MPYKPCLSWTQLKLLETNEQEWIRYYIFKEPRRTNDGMEYGKKLSEALEIGGLSGDPMLDLAIAQIPMLDISEHEIQTDWETKNGKKKITIPLLALLDTCKKDMSAFKEFKTGQKLWTPKDVHQSGQITFYATLIWLVTKKIPQDIEHIGIPTKRQPEGHLEATGEIYTIPTKREMTDIIKMLARIKKAWIRREELKAQYAQYA